MSGPVRLTTREAIALSRLSRATFWRRIAQGRLPGPVDRAREALFCRDAMMKALTLTTEQQEQGEHLSPAAAALKSRMDALAARRAVKMK